jgi:hypothetical protein
MRNSVELWVFSAALALLTASEVSAVTTICVTPPSIATCPNHTIQAAIAIANAGDIIKVAPGTYYLSSIAVPPNLDGLQIVGASKASTIIDVGNNTLQGVTTSSQIGFQISSRNVTLRNMTVRNGSQGAVLLASGAIVNAMNFTGQDGIGVFVSNSTAYGVQVTASEIHDTSIGIFSLGLGSIVKGNTITNTTFGVLLAGDQSQAQLNKVSNGVIGIEIVADGALIKSNDVRYQTLGVVALGTFPTVQSNKVFGSAIGIEAICTPSCFGGSVGSNIVTDATIEGILVASDSPGLYVTSNSIVRAGIGIVVANVAGAGDHGVFLVTNKASDIGNIINGHCYSITGDGNVAYKNKATRCSGSGLYAKGNTNTLDGNVVAASFENGVTVDGGGAPYLGNYLTLNKTTGNLGQGIAIIGNAVSTTVLLNTASANRKNFCDVNYNSTVVISNSFTDPGGPVACDIVH